MTLPLVYERWLPVVGWEDRYEVSCRGRVRAFDRVIVDALGRHRRWKGRMLRTVLHQGYPTVMLCRPGDKRRRPVHTLVLTAFDRPPEPGEECRHGPGGRADNRWPEAIRWGTRAENIYDKIRDGTDQNGERNPMAKLTAAIVLECRRRHAAGETAAGLGREFGVSKGGMRDAINGTRWAHLPMPS